MVVYFSKIKETLYKYTKEKTQLKVDSNEKLAMNILQTITKNSSTFLKFFSQTIE